MPNAHLREATADDALGIAMVHVLSWQHTYKGLLPDELLAQLNVSKRRQDWQDWLKTERELPIWVAEYHHEGGSEIVGFVSGGAERTADPPDHGEIHALYVLPSVIGQGVGYMLFTKMQRLLREQGYRQQVVWALHNNTLACEFYARQGGLPHLERNIEIGNPPHAVYETGYTWDFSIG